jgi:hypothetical protein
VQEGKRVLLVVDEAQNLARRTIEELRMLSNFQWKGKPLVQSLLLGQREFRTMMRSEGFEQLRQRVLAAYHLQPLTEEETRQYIEHRLKLVGWNGDPYIDDDVYARLYEFTGGVPRKTNLLCDRVLLYGCLEELHHINRAVIDNVLEDVKQELWSPEPSAAPGVESDYEPTMLKSSAARRRISAEPDEAGGDVASETAGETTIGVRTDTNLRSVIHELRQELKKFKDEVKQIKGRTDAE